MSNTPRTDGMIEESWHKINVPVCPVPGEFAKQLERELTEANHLRERAESSLSGAAARMRKAQDEAEIWEKKFIQQKAEEKWANRTAFLTNPLHEVLDEMESRGGNAIQRLAAYIRASDPERRSKALIAFRDDLECYDRKLTPIGIPATILPPTTEIEP